MSDATATLPEKHAGTARLLTEVLGEGGFRTRTFRDNVRFYLPADRIADVLQALRDRGGFRWLTEVGGADYLKYPGGSGSGHRFEVHYVLLHPETSERIILKAGVDDPNPTLPSAVPIFEGANWMEREVFDMYGITFEGHPDLRRILMPDEFAAYPLRKDYPLRGRGERHNFPRITREQS